MLPKPSAAGGGQFDRKKKLMNVEHRTSNLFTFTLNTLKRYGKQQNDRFAMTPPSQ